MTNAVELQGRIKDRVTTMSSGEGLSSDFILIHDGSEFQVICDSRIAYGFCFGDNVTVIGKLKEAGGDVYIMADNIVLDTQMELKF